MNVGAGIERVVFDADNRDDVRRGGTLPLDDHPPTVACKHAVVRGMLVDGRSVVHLARRGVDAYPTLIRLFDFGQERVYGWRYQWNAGEEHQHSLALVAEVHDPPAVHAQNAWRNLGTSLQIAMGLHSAFEHVEETGYNWIYGFDPVQPATEQVFWDRYAVQETFGGIVWPADRLYECAPIFELLARDERFYVACQSMSSSMESHWFCLHCALQAEGHRMHDNREPEVWERAGLIPRMDIATVQATRVAEAMLGQPASLQRRGGMDDRLLERWRNVLGLDPFATYQLAGTSFQDFYRQQYFGQRNPAAHGQKRVRFEVTRAMTIAVQAFAWIILNDYWQRHSISMEEAATRLEFDDSLRPNQIPPL